MRRQLVDELRVLGLRSDASFAEVKASYRRLARRYHPDMNPGDREAEDKFIRITKAYQALADAMPTVTTATVAATVTTSQTTASPSRPKVTIHKTAASKVTVQVNPNLTPEDQALKQKGFDQLQLLFQAQKFPRAIALVDGLAQRLTDDPEVTQWQAISYQRWGRYLVRHGHHDKARRALKKALRLDPHNKVLWQEVNRDFQRMEHASQQRTTAAK
ncbi:DnaJ domain-containing protein [Leptolyngbya iicbica]|uniref:Tetratricopeptide repeat protein n=2 Tax=Cyanophyceae TaxID=3028117 RepID=A0A4Q7E6X5_9CYAN|nr:DnaJ domain-containing protein [Leptolyngbya sp. LK]RZM78008.1 tetratricopeptide repeat protein [Leptolyngbya sp. LK]